MKRFTNILEKDLPFKQMIENTHDLVVVTTADLDGKGPVIVFVNHAFTKLMEYEADEIIGKSPNILHGDDTDLDELGKLIEQLKTRETARSEIVNYSKSGKAIWLDINIVPLYDDNGDLEFFAAIERDLTEHKRLLSELEQLSRVDSLTGVANRRFFEFRSRERFYDFNRYKTPFSLIYLDIDYFKEINDTHGHACGDAALKALTNSCKKLLRQTDTMARIGGDEFAVILNHTRLEDANKLAERMRKQVAGLQIDTDTDTVGITLSIGVASSLGGDKSIDEILKRADDALYSSKANGRNLVTSQTDA